MDASPVLPTLAPNAQAHGLTERVANLTLRLMGWRVVGVMPRAPKLVLVAPSAVVDQMAAVFAGRERFLLSVTPEGTRKRTAFWKSGFYHIARAAGVPIMPVAFDYGRRECRFGEVIVPTGDVEADVAVLRAFYAGVTQKHPANAGEIRFRE